MGSEIKEQGWGEWEGGDGRQGGRHDRVGAGSLTRLKRLGVSPKLLVPPLSYSTPTISSIIQ